MPMTDGPFNDILSPYPVSAIPELAAAALSSLLAIVCVWLAFGVRTRVMALLGLALYLGLALLVPGLQALNPVRLMELTFVVLLALPLIAFGGGRFCVYRGGWQNVI